MGGWGWGGDVLDDVIVSYFISFYLNLSSSHSFTLPATTSPCVLSVNVTCTSILKTLVVYRGEEEEEEDRERVRGRREHTHTHTQGSVGSGLVGMGGWGGDVGGGGPGGHGMGTCRAWMMQSADALGQQRRL